MPPYNTGDCSLMNALVLNKICMATICKQLAEEFEDTRAPEGTPYLVFESQEKPDLFFFSFHRSNLFSSHSIRVYGKNYTITGHSLTQPKDTYIYISDPNHSDLHCFRITLKYATALLAHCLGKAHRKGEIVGVPVLHYSRYATNRRGVASVLRAGKILFAILTYYILLWF